MQVVVEVCLNFFPNFVTLENFSTTCFSFSVKTLKIALDLNLDLYIAKKERVQQLNAVDDYKKHALFRIEVVQQQKKKWYDRFIKSKYFKEGDWDPLYHYRFKQFKGKMRTRWLGPYQIDTCHDNGMMKFKTIDETQVPLLVNGHRLKLYIKPIEKEEFTRNLLEQNTSLIQRNNAFIPK